MDKELEKDFLDMIDAHERVIYKVCNFSAKNHDELEDMSYQTMADILGTTTNNIGVKLNHIRHKLRKM